MGIELTGGIANNPAIAHQTLVFGADHWLHIQVNFAEMIPTRSELVSMPPFYDGVGFAPVGDVRSRLEHPIEIDAPQRSPGIIQKKFRVG